MQKDKTALEVASLAGHILLENGAEISRVEETMERIATHFGVDSENFFVLSNGIFTTGPDGYAKVEFIPFKGAQLERVAQVNQISRDLCSGRLDLEQAHLDLEKVRSSPGKPPLEQIAGSAVGCAGFCIIFGGGLADACASLLTGLLLWVFVIFVSAPHMSKALGNICGGALATLLSVLFFRIGIGSSLGNIIVGSLIPLIPGLAFTNGIRDIADEDYIAGATRLLDALMVFFCIAAGVVSAFFIERLLTGAAPIVNGVEPNELMASVPVQAAAAFVGTLGFSVLFGVPRSHYIHSSLLATLGWIVYLLLFSCTSLGAVASTFFASVTVAILSRRCAVLFKAPQTIFLLTSIFPMIPGGGIFWTVFFVVSGRMNLALHTGTLALGVTAAIVLAIVLARSLVSLRKHRKSQKNM